MITRRPIVSKFISVIVLANEKAQTYQSVPDRPSISQSVAFSFSFTGG